MGNQEPLDLSAVDLTQQRKFLRGFHTFGHYGQAQLSAEGDNAGQCLCQFFVVVAALDQCAVDLQFGKGVDTRFMYEL